MIIGGQSQKRGVEPFNAGTGLRGQNKEKAFISQVKRFTFL